MQMNLQMDIDKDPNIEIHGMMYVPNYITVKEQNDLLLQVDQQLWLTDLKRRVQHYGYRYDYKARGVSRDSYLGPLPFWLSQLCQNLVADQLLPILPDQVIVNEYLPGQGISAHIDCIPCFGETIASLSLGSSCMMELFHAGTGQKKEIFLEERSLIILSGEARYKWQHAIPARKSDIVNGEKNQRKRRVSLTFRKVMLNT